VYSVRVCLLEIGIWSNFIAYEPSPSPTSTLDIHDKLKMKEPKKRAFQIKDILINLAKTKLPSMMGLRYTEL